MGCDNSIYAREAFFIYINSAQYLTYKLRTIRRFVLLPQYFLEGKIGRGQPPDITHPEYFYGFVGIAIAWQVAFLIIARDPLRYRMLIGAAILEKASFGLAVVVLFVQKRVAATTLAFGIVDLIWCALFAAASWRLHDSRPTT